MAQQLKTKIATLIVVTLAPILVMAQDRERANAKDPANVSRTMLGTNWVVECFWPKEFTTVTQSFRHIVIRGPQENWSNNHTKVSAVVSQLFARARVIDTGMFARINLQLVGTGITIEPAYTTGGQHVSAILGDVHIGIPGTSTSSTSTTSTQPIATTSSTTTIRRGR